MGCTLNYNYNPGNQYPQAKNFPQAYAWYISGAQMLDQTDKSKPTNFDMSVGVKIFATKADQQNGVPPIDILNYSFDNQVDMVAIIYGQFDPAWVVPQAINPFTQVLEPLKGLKLLTAYMVRNHPILGQAGAVWD